MELETKYDRTLHKLGICLELLTYKKSVLATEVAIKLINDIKEEREYNNPYLINIIDVPIMYHPEEAFDFINNYINK